MDETEGSVKHHISILNPILSRVRTDVSAKKHDGKMYWTREPITEENLKQHLNGGPARGVCPIKAGEATTMIGLLDFDSHKGETDWEGMTAAAKTVCAEFSVRGMNPIAWRSSGGKGIHVFILWSTPQDAYSVREFLKTVIGEVGYQNGTAGVCNKEIEVFPKQDNVPSGGFGNQFILPLAGKSVPLRPSDLTPMDREYAVNMAWPVSPSVQVIAKPVRLSSLEADSISLDTLRTLLRHINPNTGHDPWVKVGMALHHETGGSEDGLLLWDEWSQEGNDYPGYNVLAYKWASFSDNKEAPATLGTLIYRARQGGWKEERAILDPSDHSSIARKIIDTEFRAGDGDVSLLRTQGQWFSYHGECYQERDEESIRAVVRRFLDKSSKIDPKGEVKPFRPAMSHISAVTDALGAATLKENLSAPAWLDKNDRSESRDYISMKNGLFHISTRILKSHTPQFFTLNSLPYGYEPDEKPTEWLKFLNSVWGNDQESKDTLQEIFGYLLTADNSYQKMFLFKGPKRSGKGTIGRILKEMLGASNVCGPTLSSMAGNFGLQPVIGKLAAIVPDARIGGQTNKQAIVEKLLMVSGGDNVTVDRKHKDPWTGFLSSRIIMFTNETPQLGDASGALASRFIVLAMEKSFYGQEDLGLESRLLKEMPQIFCWALDGLARLRERGRFIQPESAAYTVAELEELNSPLQDFVASHCELGTGYRVPKDQLYTSYKIWCERQGRTFPSTLAMFSRDLQNACPTIKSVRAGSEGNREQVFDGVKIKDHQSSAPMSDNEIMRQLRQVRQVGQARQGPSSLHT